MIGDLARRAAPSGRGRLLDLACGTGQLAFPLRDWFTDVWAVDAEPGMTEVVRAKADAVGAAHVRAVTARTEDLDAEPGSFELIVIGNAFHRLNRLQVAQRAYTWLKPGGCLALCWSTSPWAGPWDWQQALDRLLRSWQNTLGASGRVPPGWDRERQQDPDHQVLSRAGFDVAGRHEFSVEYHWTIPVGSRVTAGTYMHGSPRGGAARDRHRQRPRRHTDPPTPPGDAQERRDRCAPPCRTGVQTARVTWILPAEEHGC
ncbi:class I SAM-dependent methyltransferase [Streptomyces afghaniensis]|uniref:class I SAM-dependent methyltransferase n=1 Tax=Streptomyces afghaniensis TaxID=66865 RepID=UPI00378B6511